MGVCWLELKPRLNREGLSVAGQDQNRTREIRPSGIEGGLQETWFIMNARACLLPDTQKLEINNSLKGRLLMNSHKENHVN